MRLATSFVLCTCLSASVFAQQDASSRLRPVPGPPVEINYDLRTRTLRPSRALGAFFGPAVLYAQTCPSGFFIGLSPGDQIIDEGQLPAPNDGLLASAGGTGCAPVYTVNAFEIGYCSNQPANDLAVTFHSSYVPCGGASLSPGTRFLLPGLPGSSSGGTICYNLTVDLMGTSFEFTLVASGDGAWNNDEDRDLFAYTYEFTNLTATQVGAVIAGGPVFLGTGCDFAVGTTFEVADLTGASPEGTGYGSVDAFGLNQCGIFSCSSCYFFGGWPAHLWSSFHLRLYSEHGCNDDLGTPTCAGDGSYPSTSPLICPCGNTSSPGSNEGCVNSSGSSGGTLTGSGSASVATDNLRLDATHPASNGGLLLCNTSVFAIGVAVLDGLACVGGGPRVFPGADDGNGDDQAAGDGVRNLGSTTPGNGLMGQVNTTFPGFFTPGTTYWVQYWYRDVLCGPPPAPCITPCTTRPPTASNFTNAYTFVAW